MRRGWSGLFRPKSASIERTCFHNKLNNILSDFSDFTWLISPAAAPLLEECARATVPLHRQLQRLRKVVSPVRAGLVVEQVQLRRRAVAKFGVLAKRMFFTEVALQQATDVWIARYKAARLNSQALVHDYCCGVGGDLLAWAERGPIRGWDRAPQMVQLAAANLQAVGDATVGCVQVASVEQLTPHCDEVWHLDPDRRPTGRRSVQLAHHAPGPAEIFRLRRAAPRGVLKLAPATQVPEGWQQEAELEWISRDRQCRQLVVWFDALAGEPGQRRATAVLQSLPQNNTEGIPRSERIGARNGLGACSPLEEPVAHTFVGHPDTRAEVLREPARFLYDLDPAIRAAGLTGAFAMRHNLAALGQEAGYLTSTVPCSHPLLARFEIHEQLPLRLKPLAQALRARGLGQLEIKKRGVDIDPEKLRRQLKLRGDAQATLLLTKLGQREVAFLAQRGD